MSDEAPVHIVVASPPLSPALVERIRELEVLSAGELLSAGDMILIYGDADAEAYAPPARHQPRQPLSAPPTVPLGLGLALLPHRTVLAGEGEGHAVQTILPRSRYGYDRPAGGAYRPAGPGRLQEPQRSMDFIRVSVGFAGAAGVAIYKALKARGGFTGGLLAAAAGAMAVLAGGFWASTAGCGYSRLLGLANICGASIPIVIAMGEGAVVKIEDAAFFMDLFRKVLDLLQNREGDRRPDSS